MFTVTGIGSRKSILRRKGRCFVCLQPFHISRFCSEKYKCVKCQGRHNVSICGSQRNQGEKSGKDYIRQVSTNIVGNKRSSTFLQSANGMITDESTKRYKNVRILFDNCSQKSFLTQEVAKALNLPRIRKEKIIINGFGGKDEKLVILDIVRVIVHNTQVKKCGENELSVVPFICKPLCNQEIELAQATYEHFVSLKLADSSDGEAKLNIDLLIGADYYWDFVTRDATRGD